MTISRRRFRRALAAGGIRFLHFAFGRLPRRPALAAARVLGLLAWMADRTGRRRTRAHLALAFGPDRDGNGPDQKLIGRRSYQNLAAGLVDLARVSWLAPSRLDSFVNASEETIAGLAGITDRGRGVIMLTPHLGNWELLTGWLAARGFPVHFVGRQAYDERLEPLYARVRSAHGASWISRGGAFRRIETALRDGDIVIMLIDQDTTRVHGTFVDFFDRPAWTPTGPAALARLTGAALLPGALVWESPRSYRLILSEPVATVVTGDETSDDRENTRRITACLEELIREHPDQWVWFHRRWQTRPPAPGPENAAGSTGTGKPGAGS